MNYFISGGKNKNVKNTYTILVDLAVKSLISLVFDGTFYCVSECNYFKALK